MSLIGYVRVSTVDQEPAEQVSALRTAGYTMVYVEHTSATGVCLHKLLAALADAVDGGTFVVWRLDRLARSLTGLEPAQS